MSLWSCLRPRRPPPPSASRSTPQPPRRGDRLALLWLSSQTGEVGRARGAGLADGEGAGSGKDWWMKD